MSYMLDTNICIYVIKQQPEQVLRRFRDDLSQGLYLSSISLAELALGVAKSAYPERNKADLLRFLAALTVLPFDDYAAAEYGTICAWLQKQGTPIGTMNTLIAAHAKAENMTLVTNNVREFARVPGLKIENWVDM